jgi:uncharacterized protein
MKARTYNFRLLIFIAIIFSFFITSFSPNFTLISYASPSMQKVYDYADLFTPEEVDNLEAISLEQGELGKVDIVFITVDTLNNKSRKEFLEDFYDEHGFGYDQKYGDTALILLNMDPNDRGVEIQGYGMAEHYVHNDRIEHILDDIVPLLSDGDYFKAMEEFALQVAYYMNEEKGVNTNPVYGDETSGNYYGEASYDGPSDYYGEESFFESIIFRIIISVIIGAVSVIIMAYNSSGKVTTTNRTYLDHHNSRVVAHHDLYVRTHTSRVRKPKQESSSGGRSSGGGGISSGGHSHSGGGRSF